MKQIHLLQIIIIFSLINFIQMSEKIIKINNLRNLQMQKEEGNIKNDENRDHHTNSNFSPEGNVNNSSNQNDIGKDDHDNYNENPTFNDSYIGDFDFHSSNKMNNFSDNGENEDNNIYENENIIEENIKEEENITEEINKEEENIINENNNEENDIKKENIKEEENITEENNNEENNIIQNKDIEENINEEIENNTNSEQENEENINIQIDEENLNIENIQSTNNNSLNEPPDDKLEEPPDDKQEKPPEEPPENPPEEPQEKPPEEPPEKPSDETKEEEKDIKENSKKKDREDIKNEFGPNIEQLARSGEKIIDSNYIISAVEVGSISSLTRVDLTKCIQLLESFGIISPSDTLIILQMDYTSNEQLTSEVSYALYYSNSTQIDLSLCNETEIKITSSVNTSMISNYDEAKSIYENDKYDIFNINDAFYNDICSTYTSNDGTDVTLKDRQNNYFESISFCDDNCIYDGYDFQHDLVNCICNSSSSNTSDSFSLNTFFKKFINVFKESNIKLVKCYMKVFELEKLKKNIGSYIMIGFFGLELIILILYCETGLISTKEIYEMIYKERENKKNKEQSNIKNENKNTSIIGNLDFTGISIQSKVNLNESQNNCLNEKFRSFNISPFIQFPPYKKKDSEINTQQKINNDNSKIIEKITKSIIIYSKNKYGLTNIVTPRKEIEKINKFISKNNFSNNKKNKTFISIPKRNLDNFDKDLTDKKLNKLPYEQAIEKDKRSFSHYYLSEIKNSQSFIFTFIISDENNKFIKIILFIFNISMYFCFNTLFFSDESISHIYSKSGSYDYIYFIPKAIISTFISGIINLFFKFLALNNSKKLKVNLNSYKKYLKSSQIKLGIFFLMQFLFLLFFWYFTSCFCAVYVNTQKHLIKNCIISFLFSMIFPFFYVIIITILRLVGIRKKNKILYNISKFLSIF